MAKKKQITRIFLDIESCEGCPFLRVEKVYTADSFENVSSWHCTKKRKKIDGYVDTFDKVSIPTWCPQKLKGKSATSNEVYLGLPFLVAGKKFVATSDSRGNNIGFSEIGIKSNPDCTNKSCMGGVLTRDGQSGRPCRKCNPTNLVVKEAMRITAKDVRAPFVVRKGIVKKQIKRKRKS